MNEKNRTPINFEGFTSVDETVSPHLLQPNILFALKNAVLNNPKGVVRVRGGFTQLNTNTTTSPVSKLIDTKDKDGNSFLLAGMNTKIQKSSGGAWSDVLTGMTTTGWFTNTSYRDGLIISSDDDPPFWISGSGWNTSGALQLPKPVSDFIIIQRAKTTYGDLDPNASYSYCLVYKSEYGDVSPPSHVIYMGKDGGVGSNNQVTTTTTLRAFYLTAIPVPTDARVTVKTLYRTEGNGEILYKLADLDPDITDYEDITADQDLDFSDTPIYMRVPSTARHSLVHQDRVWFGKISLLEKFVTFTKIPCKTKGSDSTAPSGTVYEDVLSGGTVFEFNWNGSTSGFVTGLTAGYHYQYMCTWVDETGQESDPVFTDVASLTAGSPPTYHRGLLRGIPTNNRCSGTGVDPTYTIRRLYRTRGYKTTFNTYDYNYYLIREDVINTNVLLNDAITNTYDDYEYDLYHEAGVLSTGSWYIIPSLSAGDNFTNVGYVSAGVSFQATGTTPTTWTNQTKVYLRRGTSGTLVVGRSYIIYTLNAGDNFTNVGYVSTGVPFVATGTTPTTWANGTEVFGDYYVPSVAWVAPVAKEYPSAVAFSRISRPATFYLEDIRNIYEDDKDEITGLLDDGNGVVVLKTNNLYKIYTTGASENWYVRRHYADIGCDDYKSVYQKGDVSFFRHNTKVYLMASGQVPMEIGEPKKNTLKSYSTTLQTSATNEWFLLLAQISSSAQALLIYDTAVKAWYEFPFSSKSAQAIVTKQFAMTNYTVGDFYLMLAEITYKYDTSIIYDNYGGNNTYISVTVTLPAMYLKGVEFKLRKTVCNFDRSYTNGQCTFSLYDMDNSNTLILTHNNTESYNSGSHKINFNSNTVSTKMYVSLTGYFKQINNIRFEVRPKRIGL